MDIINVVTVNKRQTGQNSVAMEEHAVIKTIDRLLEELNTKKIVTDTRFFFQHVINGRLECLLQLSLAKFIKNAKLLKFLHVHTKFSGKRGWGDRLGCYIVSLS